MIIKVTIIIKHLMKKNSKYVQYLVIPHLENKLSSGKECSSYTYKWFSIKTLLKILNLNILKSFRDS